ncbi:hypothetical protein [Methylobacterium sp. CCH5-D2]|uniref:hypothetical protein n=1 Tax=Methylobacterium sp. CCH5-D2 TaxID=1768765 RepID=UPI0008298412|nr:hypothetical protein [Methylobacterium sp. CCH5-D2]
MGELAIAIRTTYRVDMGDVLSRVTLKAPMKAARKEVRFEVQHLIYEMCDRLLDCPPLTEQYLAWHLCREGIADPLPGHEPPGWEQILRDRAEFETSDPEPSR